MVIDTLSDKSLADNNFGGQKDVLPNIQSRLRYPTIKILVDRNSKTSIAVRMRGQPSSYEQSFLRYGFDSKPILDHFDPFTAVQM